MRNGLMMAASAALLLAAPAVAAPWKVDGTASTLTFEGEHAGEKFAGRFAAFTPVIEFDEAAPEKGNIRVTIEMASATVEGKDRQESLPTADWFSVAQFPTATFTSTAIAKAPAQAGGHAYVAQGNLVIRGVSKQVALPFRLTTEGAATVARGELVLNRQDFGIGQGEWKSDAYIKNPVTVHFVVHARKP